ncbi:VOC family protein [Chitinophaga sp. Cy-1792]|uniref:VOC family protein n=1 Tax=Chitinophaga sp. Cy-1792 TaxID=2608339 RepID=UPI001423A20A|nr:VOC family protein [Chitinophaga sp. Cy-1792]NIG54527.1 glyoxalase [Chitinophaga sp. Cy-1792]
MGIEHIAIWVANLEHMRLFYIKYFGATSNDLYFNAKKLFYSYFLTFETGPRLEIMHMDTISEQRQQYRAQHRGFVHMAFKMGSREAVDDIITTLRQDGYKIIGEPRVTGDGYYEGIFLDPEENIVEVQA